MTPTHSTAVRPALRLGSLYLGLLTATLLAACTPEPTPQPSAPPLSEARARNNGETVTVEGFVTVPPGAFVSALGDEGFAIQDSSAGIYVKVAQKLGFGLGTKVRVTGQLDEQDKLRILKAEASAIEQLQGTQQIAAKDVATGDVKEPVEGLLIRTSGNITQTFQDDSPYGYKLYINDGSGEVQVFVHVSANFNKDTLAALRLGQRITVIGLAAQYNDTYEVAPRQPSDLTTN